MAKKWVLLEEDEEEELEKELRKELVKEIAKKALEEASKPSQFWLSCGRCGGTGRYLGFTLGKCDVCKGNGGKYVSGSPSDYVTCKKCGGKGSFGPMGNCDVCGGWGKVLVR